MKRKTAGLKIKAVALMISCVLMAGCASVSTSNLSRPATERSLTLKEPFIYTRETAGLGNRTLMTVRLSPGRYVSTFEDQTGTFFRSTGNELVERRERFDFGAKEVSKTFTHLHDGGVYVPKNPADPVKLFVVAGTLRHVQLPDVVTSSLPSTDPLLIFVPTSSATVATVTGIAANAVIAMAIAAERGNYALYLDGAQPDGHQLKALLVEER